MLCTSFHYTPLQIISLHSTANHFITLHCKSLHYTPLQIISLHSTANHFITLHCKSFHYTPLQIISLHSTANHFITLHCKSFHYTPLQIISLHSTANHFITLQCTAFYYTLMQSISLSYTAKQFITLQWKALALSPALWFPTAARGISAGQECGKHAREKTVLIPRAAVERQSAGDEGWSCTNPNFFWRKGKRLRTRIFTQNFTEASEV